MSNATKVTALRSSSRGDGRWGQLGGVGEPVYGGGLPGIVEWNGRR
jgi:hypothetical protein